MPRPPLSDKNIVKRGYMGNRDLYWLVLVKANVTYRIIKRMSVCIGWPHYRYYIYLTRFRGHIKPKSVVSQSTCALLEETPGKGLNSFRLLVHIFNAQSESWDSLWQSWICWSSADRNLLLLKQSILLYNVRKRIIEKTFADTGLRPFLFTQSRA